MAYKITIDKANLGKGAEVFIDGLGTFKNGETAVVSNDQVEHFRNAHGYTDTSGGTPQWVQGPTLGQAFGEGTGITVERVSESQASPEDGSAPEQSAKASSKKEATK